MSHVRISPFRATIGSLAVVAFLVGSPLLPGAAAQPAPRAAAAGSTYGGVTSQGFPVIVDVTANKRLVVRVLTAVRLTCAPSGGVFTTTDGFRLLVVSRSGRFQASFGPNTQRNPDGTTTDFSGRMTARFNKARTQLTGTWSLTAVDHDAAGAVTDTCPSGALSWRAKQ